MDFSDALRIVKRGGRARRAAWQAARRAEWQDVTLELVRLPPQGETGRAVMPVLMVYYPHHPDNILRPFAGANWDLLADDWEIVSE
jgi:hypothetical protein